MLDTIDLDLRLGKDDYRAQTDGVGEAISVLQRRARAARRPVIILFEGWTASGRGDSIARLVEHLDPRGFVVYTSRSPAHETTARPWLWRYWQRLPLRGDISIFDRGWYSELIMARLEGEIGSHQFETALDEIRCFERELIAGGALILKFWLHISRKEQKRRLEAWADDEYQRWRVEGVETREVSYRKIAALVSETLEKTNWGEAPWTVVPAENDRYRRATVLGTTRAALEAVVAGHPVTTEPPAPAPHPDPLPADVAIPADSPLATADLTRALDRDRYESHLDRLQDDLRELAFRSFRCRVPLVLVFEGWDAAGKGGAIKRLTKRLDPRGYRVIPVAAPSGDEKSHHYLWRFWRTLPRDGHVAIFDRSWYGRVLVERVEGFATDGEWRRAYDEINAFERTLQNAGVVLAKFWMHTSPDEQLARFRAREAEPHKRYKLTDEDWRNRGRYREYLAAVDDMLRRTSPPSAPWTIVEANDKLFARIKVLKTVRSLLRKAVD